MPERNAGDAPIADVLAACQAAYEKRLYATLWCQYPRLRAELGRLQQELQCRRLEKRCHCCERTERKEAALRERLDLDAERVLVNQRLARKEISRAVWMEHGREWGKRDDAWFAKANAALGDSNG